MMSLQNVFVLPFAHRLQSSLWWRTICGPWCRWLRSWGCQNVWSDPPAAGSSTSPSDPSWSGRGIVPGKIFILFQQLKLGASFSARYIIPNKESKTKPFSPFQTQSFHRSESADLQRKEGSQLPFHRWGLRGPTSPQLCYNPEIDKKHQCNLKS